MNRNEETLAAWFSCGCDDTAAARQLELSPMEFAHRRLSVPPEEELEAAGATFARTFAYRSLVRLEAMLARDGATVVTGEDFVHLTTALIAFLTNQPMVYVEKGNGSGDFGRIEDLLQQLVKNTDGKHACLSCGMRYLPQDDSPFCSTACKHSYFDAQQYRSGSHN